MYKYVVCSSYGSGSILCSDSWLALGIYEYVIVKNRYTVDELLLLYNRSIILQCMP
jgi:hypothetical protein